MSSEMDAINYYERYLECREQLAAEREKAKQAGEANIRTNEMLTKVRRERDAAQQQLDDEREKREEAERDSKADSDENDKLRKDLDAERKEYDKLFETSGILSEEIAQLTLQLEAAVELLRYARAAILSEDHVKMGLVLVRIRDSGIPALAKLWEPTSPTATKATGK